VFGSISWSKDESKIIFIGERAEPAAYKNYWEDEAPTVKEEKQEEEENKSKEEKKKEKDKKEHTLEEKYLHQEDFGETLVGKKRPAIFVFDLKAN
jgi:isoaspartyl peptidase/L-asparaginase-like protein (Ntn-hydrolase superfamily)